MSGEGVRVVACRCVPYDLGFSRPWRTARGTLTRRRGWTIVLETDAGVSGFGECAPLADAGTEAPEQAEASLSGWLGRIPGMDLDSLWAALETEAAPPSVRCALEGAVAHVRATRQGVPLARLINPEAPLEFAVNASIGVADAGLTDRASAAIAAGFSVLKVKVGAGPAQDEQRCLLAIAQDLHPGISFRIDANGAWDAAAALRWIPVLEQMPIESVEEPLRDADPKALRAMQRDVSFPLALDESLPRYLADGLIDDLPVQRVVIKPMVAGGIRPCRRMIEQSSAEAVFTTTLEAAPGRWLVAHMAAALGSDCHHGLDTGHWLAEDVGTGPVIEAGRCRLAPAA